MANVRHAEKPRPDRQTTYVVDVGTRGGLWECVLGTRAVARVHVVKLPNFAELDEVPSNVSHRLFVEKARFSP